MKLSNPFDTLYRRLRDDHTLLRRDLLASLASFKEMVKNMPTRQELDDLKAALKQAIADETKQVTDAIQALKDQLANGNPITQADLDDLTAAVQGVKDIDPDTV